MNRCDEMKEALAEVALGRPAGEALSAHVAACAACAGELDRRRALAQRMDAAVLALVRAQPSGQLSEAVAARVHLAQPRAQRRQWSGIAVGAALAASVALIFGLRALQPHTAPVPNTVALTQWRSPTAALLEPRDGVSNAPLRDGRPTPASVPSHSELTSGVTHAS